MHVKKTASSKWKTNIAPRPLQKFERNMDVSKQCSLVWNGDGGFELGLPDEMVVTTNTKRKIGAPTSHYKHTWKGPGLQWKGKRDVTTKQLQQQLFDECSQQKKVVGKKLLGTQSSQSDANPNP
ncbi:hypothetical protein V6N13_113542 [Hibiscus sabdariffa]|uniref:Uncharacterized protein n=1 Tax=Hibiscus sabdariffa TaxID=183260 RepID=A0ABR2TZR8_9ROSI